MTRRGSPRNTECELQQTDKRGRGRVEGGEDGLFWLTPDATLAAGQSVPSAHRWTWVDILHIHTLQNCNIYYLFIHSFPPSTLYLNALCRISTPGAWAWTRWIITGPCGCCRQRSTWHQRDLGTQDSYSSSHYFVRFSSDQIRRPSYQLEDDFYRRSFDRRKDTMNTQNIFHKSHKIKTEGCSEHSDSFYWDYLLRFKLDKPQAKW